MNLPQQQQVRYWLDPQGDVLGGGVGAKVSHSVPVYPGGQVHTDPLQVPPF